jgi:integrase
MEPGISRFSLRTSARLLLTAPELDRLLSAAEAAGPRSLVAVALLAIAGMSADEVASLRFGDVDTSNGIIRVRSPDGHGGRLVQLPILVVAALEELRRVSLGALTLRTSCLGMTTSDVRRVLRRCWANVARSAAAPATTEVL